MWKKRTDYYHGMSVHTCIHREIIKVHREKMQSSRKREHWNYKCFGGRRSWLREDEIIGRVQGPLVTTDPANDVRRIRQSVERGAMGRVALFCFLPVFVLLIHSRWRGRLSLRVLLAPVSEFGFTFYFKTSSRHYER